MLPVEERLSAYLKRQGLSLQGKISKGYSSEAYRVRSKAGKGVRSKTGKSSKPGEEFALKIEREKSPRKEMAEREAANLQTANAAGVGPKLIDCDTGNRIILMEFIEGPTFDRYLFAEHGPGREALQGLLRQLFSQASALDRIGLDHGQLAGRGRNILVRAGKPVIIDFEKASAQRKPHNTNQLASFLILNRHSAIAKRVRELLSSTRQRTKA